MTDKTYAELKREFDTATRLLKDHEDIAACYRTLTFDLSFAMAKAARKEEEAAAVGC